MCLLLRESRIRAAGMAKSGILRIVYAQGILIGGKALPQLYLFGVRKARETIMIPNFDE